MRQNDSPLRSKEQAARYLDVSLRTFYGLVASGLIAPTIVGERKKYHIKELDRYLEAQTVRRDQSHASPVLAEATA